MATAPALPPFAIVMPAFRLRALASLAGRAPLGGPREVVLACYVVARLALPFTTRLPESLLDDDKRAARAAAAKAWLGSMALPAGSRPAFGKLIDLIARPVNDQPAPPPARKSGAIRVSQANGTASDALATLGVTVAETMGVMIEAAAPWLDTASRHELTQLALEIDSASSVRRQSALLSKP